jgi:hypothetical protein
VALLSLSLRGGFLLEPYCGRFDASTAATSSASRVAENRSAPSDVVFSVTCRSLSITIDPPRPLVITNQSSTLPAGARGSSYAASLFADGGVKPSTWAIVAGQLPPGLNLSGNRIQGTPTAAGTYTFTARVRDSGGQEATREFSITVT